MTSPNQIDRQRIKEADQQLEVLREPWPLASHEAQEVRPLAMGVAHQGAAWPL